MTPRIFYILEATALPERHPQRIYLEKPGTVVIGERGRLCRNCEPQYFRSEKEAEEFAAGFLKNKGPQFGLKVVPTAGPISIKTGRQLAEDAFIDHNYYVKVTKVPEFLFATRENLRPVYLAGDLVIGKGNTLAKVGRQRWFQTHKEALAHLKRLEDSPAFRGYGFEVVAAE